MPKSSRLWEQNPTLPSLITRGNAASTNTLTASSDNTSQRVQTSLRCPTPTSKGSKINSTPAPERYSAPNPARGLPDCRLTRLLHFTVEWARPFASGDRTLKCRMSWSKCNTLCLISTTCHVSGGPEGFCFSNLETERRGHECVGGTVNSI